ncbi:hypothetical protein [Aequorivita vladivostokensis]|uniref:Peptidase M43 pregnancy-associated plasma-A domain-containing protein n=1 Tax=Aequorivita vladivostokensis TaxID=171194 RepID=A0ABR5DLR2_9FLAO|nr:hypothetical protein [Aequorivita vladivostokensis]KJJ39715.1 hypothetical protein MB09_00615 [Aequorivita vladivostokensis]
MFSGFAYSQTDNLCITPTNYTPDTLGAYSKSTSPSYINNFPSRTFNIFYGRINKSDGSYSQPGWPVTLEKAKASVALLNSYYKPFNICFNLTGMDTINSTAHHTGSNLYNINLYAENNGYVKSDAFNIYAPHELIQGAGESWLKNTKIAMTGSLIAIGTILPHEIGHCFNLHHTFGPGNSRPDPLNCERVTRIPSDPEYNAHMAGDMVIDTNAVPNFNLEQHSYYAYALLEAGLVPIWSDGIQIAKNPNGFNGLINATAIAQALADYGFTQTEINYLRYNPAIRDAYTDVPNCLYAPDGRINDPTVDFLKIVEDRLIQ